MNSLWERYHRISRDINTLNSAMALLEWDHQTYMPKGGIGARAETFATLRRMAHEMLTSAAFADLLERLSEETRDLPYESDEASMIRAAKRAHDKAVKLPARLVEEFAKVTAHAKSAWETAREDNDYPSFEPHLERIVALEIEKAQALGYENEPYDALLDEFEPEMLTQELVPLFAELRERLVPLVQQIAERQDAVDDSILRRGFDEDGQWQASMEVLRGIGFDLDKGRQDRSAHPFTISLAPSDVRLTTRISPDYLGSAIFASIHEGGHGMYEQGLPEAFAFDALGEAVSLQIHESQSRLWENLIGRSLPFWEHFLPKFKKLFPGKLDDVDATAMYRSVNKVIYPSKIRVEADEVTYNLHIILRFELERGLISGEIGVKDARDAWNEKSREYLGFTPADDREGILQDIHWSLGAIGYFPTYTLGTVLAAQLYECMSADRPDLEEGIAKGQFAPIKQWMTERIYRHGSRFMPKDLIARVTGGPLQAEPYLRYIENKFRELYGLS